MIKRKNPESRKSNRSRRRLLRPAAACLMALTAVCLISGCGKKNEKIDLSSTHTTAAETMAPSSSPKETESSAGITLEPGIDNAVNSNSGTSASGNGSGAAVTKNQVKTSLTTYTSGKVSIQYPVVENLDNASDINALIKKNALSIVDAYDIDEANDTLNIQCKVISADRSRIILTYTGSLTVSGGAHPSNLFYTNTIDVRSASSLDLPYLTDPAVLADYVLSADCIYQNTSPELKSAMAQINAGRSKAYYTDLFSKADFPYDGSFPESFSYEYEGDIYVSIPVSHAAGDYVIAIFTPENK